MTRRVNGIDVNSALEKVAAADENLIHIKAFDLPKQEKKLVIDTAGIYAPGRGDGQEVSGAGVAMISPYP